MYITKSKKKCFTCKFCSHYSYLEWDCTKTGLDIRFRQYGLECPDYRVDNDKKHTDDEEEIKD